MSDYDLTAKTDAVTEERFPLLRALAVLCKVLGWVNLAVALAPVVVNLLAGSGSGPAGRQLLAILGLAVMGVVGLAAAYLVAESILVILAIEENTRLAAIRIRRLLSVPAAGTPDGPPRPAAGRF